MSQTPLSQAGAQPVPPVALSILAEAGRLGGSNGRYEKFLPDLDGLYRDTRAYQARLAEDDGQPVYWMEATQTEPGPGGLITGISVLEPGTVRGGVRHDPRGRERFATLFCYAADAGQDYSIMERAGGMKSLVVADGDGWSVQPNPDHRGYQPTEHP